MAYGTARFTELYFGIPDKGPGRINGAKVLVNGKTVRAEVAVGQGTIRILPVEMLKLSAGGVLRVTINWK